MTEAKETKHTPGKWSVTADGLNVKSVAQDLMIALDPKETSIIGEAKANAHLIAAAPELLEALEELLIATEGCKSRDGMIKADPLHSANRLAKAEKAAMAIVARAKGGSVVKVKNSGLAWFGFWVFLAVFAVVDHWVFVSGYESLFQTHRTSEEKELQLLKIEEAKLKIKLLNLEGDTAKEQP